MKAYIWWTSAKRCSLSHTNMAEGGGEEDLNNPFSFKSYVKKKTTQQDDQDIDTDDIFAITSSAPSSRKKEKQSLVVADDGVIGGKWISQNNLTHSLIQERPDDPC